MNLLKKCFSSKVYIGIQVIISLVFLCMLFNFAVLPDKYLYGIIAGIIVLCLTTFFLQFKSSEKSVRRIISRILAVIVSIGLVILCIEINRGTSFINSFSGINYETDALSVIVLKNSSYTKLEYDYLYRIETEFNDKKTKQKILDFHKIFKNN